ncbi:integrase catalytic domain-containing protein [Trichonephila clavipes]|nr:integrase catalytic domain-containing protein [Trichonephila clavipes]
MFNLVCKPDEALASYMASEGIDWKFLPPRAPNFGGLWEAGVKSFKFYLKRVVGNIRLTYCHTHNLLQVPIAELAERWTELPQVSDESRSFFRVHTGYFSNIPKCIKAEFIASWGCSQSSVVSSSQR